MSIQEIESLALRLPASQRARLAQHLIASLDEDDEVAQAWAEEATRRADAAVSGEVETLPKADVLDEVRRAV